MKPILVCILATVLLTACDKGQDNGQSISPKDIKNPNTLSEDSDSLYPEMTFNEKHHNFGTLKQGEVVTHDFKFTNTGKASLIIGNAESGCGCTIPEIPKEPIAPGEKGKIKVQFDSEGRSNKVKKTVTITANTSPNLTNLTIEAFVQQP